MYFFNTQFYWWRKLEYPEKTTDLPQVTDKLFNFIYIDSHKLQELLPKYPTYEIQCL